MTPSTWQGRGRRFESVRGLSEGPVEGQIADQAKAHGLPEDRVLEEVILAPQAVKRLIEPDEVAATVAFLLSPDGRAFTGVPVVMDQGWSAR